MRDIKTPPNGGFMQFADTIGNKIAFTHSGEARGLIAHGRR